MPPRRAGGQPLHPIYLPRRRSVEEHGYQGFLGVPLRVHGRIIGALNVYARGRRQFTSDEVSLLPVFADQASLAIEKAHLLRQAPGGSAVFRVRVDPQLRQVLVNLISNAIKYTLPGEEIAIRITSDDGSVRWAFRDSGIGILFERSTAPRMAWKRRGPGSGCTWSASSSSSSAAGWGVPRRSGEGARPRSRPAAHERTPGRRVLVVEDDRFLRRACEASLRQRRLTVLLATDGEAGLRAARQERPDLVLLDLLMPKLGGLEVLRALRADPATANLPVLVLSNSSRESDVSEIHRLGVARYFVKANLSLQEPGDQVVHLLEG